ncbi:hypothetical protein Tco_1051960 [Tanacetum coccineum]
MGDENPIRTLGDYSKPSHEGYRNTIELPVGNNVGRILQISQEKSQNQAKMNTRTDRVHKSRKFSSKSVAIRLLNFYPTAKIDHPMIARNERSRLEYQEEGVQA